MTDRFKLRPPELGREWMAWFVRLRIRGSIAPVLEPRPEEEARWYTLHFGLERESSALVADAVIPIIRLAVFGAYVCVLGNFFNLLRSWYRPAEEGSLFDVWMSGLMPPIVLFSCWASLRYLVWRPISSQEIDRIVPQLPDPAQRQFVKLVRSVLGQPVPVVAESDLRIALRELAEATSRLPIMPRVPLDVETMTREAEELVVRATDEMDNVVADSLQRRAASIRSRADSYQRSAAQISRSTALRGEVEARLAALESRLSGFLNRLPDHPRQLRGAGPR